MGATTTTTTTTRRRRRRMDVFPGGGVGEEVIGLVVVRTADDAEGGTGGWDAADPADVPVLGPCAVLLVGGFRRGLLTSRVGPPQHGIRSNI